MEDYSRKIAEAALEIKAIKLSPDKPFVWASGYQMPIYNDNRMHLGNPPSRRIITNAFLDVIEQQRLPDVVAGTSTAGIPWGVFISKELRLPMVYVRDKPKDHGLRNQIEGIDAESDLEGRTVVLIEDLISTGGSSVSAVQALRNANGKCDSCLSIFNYGFSDAAAMFKGELPYDKEKTKKLETPCAVKSLLTYDELMEVVREKGYFSDDQMQSLAEWRSAPFKWGENHGFPKVEKK